MIFELIYANNIESQHLIAHIPIKYLYSLHGLFWFNSFFFLIGFLFIQIRLDILHNDSYPFPKAQNFLAVLQQKKNSHDRTSWCRVFWFEEMIINISITNLRLFWGNFHRFNRWYWWPCIIYCNPSFLWC